MKIKKVEKELLLRGSEKGLSYILTHTGFNFNMELSDTEWKILSDLAIKITNTDSAIIINDLVFVPYWTGYNGGTALAGIKIKKAVRCD